MLTSQQPEIRSAYRVCEQITKSQARNFGYGIALLPADKRRALSAVYAFARRIDDIGDGQLPAADKLAALAAARRQVAALADEPAPPDDQVLIALADAAARFPISLAAFGELIDGCEADVRGTVYLTFADLECYCRCVAGSIGRLSLAIFGTPNLDQAAPLADALGIALQLTNILRDVTEDAALGRVYLPAEDLDRFGCMLTADRAAHGGPDAQIDRMEPLVRFEAERAREWYARGLTLLPLLDRRSAASAAAMAGIYSRLLEHIAARPAAALQARMSLPTRQKLSIAAVSLARMASPRRSSLPAQRSSGAG